MSTTIMADVPAVTETAETPEAAIQATPAPQKVVAKRAYVKRAVTLQAPVKKARKNASAVSKPVAEPAVVSAAAVVKKTAVKKTAVKKTAVKKAAVKKAAVKNTAVKNTAVKKVAVKKVAVKKTAVKNNAVKKVAVKKTAVKNNAVKNAAVKQVTTVAADVPRTDLQPGKSLAQPAQNSSEKIKPKKPKLIRDSFTIPENEYQVLEDLKKRCLKAGVEIKKSDLIRIGIASLHALTVAQLGLSKDQLQKLKVGRPKK